MKKLAVGCAVVAGLAIVVVGIGLYFLYGTARQYYEGYAELAEIPAMNEQIHDQSDYRPPVDQRMTASQVERYVDVQRAMADTLGNRFEELDEKYERLARSIEEEERDPNIGEVMALWVDVMSLLTDAKRAQVEALNEKDLSLSEYQWIRQQTLTALGYGSMTWNLEALIDDPTRFVGAPPPDEPDLEALQHNRALLEEHEDAMEEWLVFSFFGL